MSQTTTGVRAVLSHPAVYDGLQALLGAARVRREFVKSFPRPTPGLQVLDAGCGTGVILDYLPADVGYQGCDLSSRYIEAARARFGHRAEFHCLSLDELPTAWSGRFDVVIAIGVLHHLDDDVAGRFMASAHRLLRPGGRLVSMDPCLGTGQNPVARFLIRNDGGRNVRDRAGYLRLAAAHFSHAHGELRHRSWIPYTHWIMECTT
jgi:SAM-dependent methyltransferase